MNSYTFNGINSISAICGETDRENSEKSVIYRLNDAESKAFAGVFEGYGSYSELKYPEYENRSGAYIGTRLAASGAVNWFSAGHCQLNDGDAARLRTNIDILLNHTKRQLKLEETPLFVKKARIFPVSGAICAVDFSYDDSVDCEFLWAGNCRGFVLDGYGLCQITADDTYDDQDAYRNRAKKAKLVNVINADKGYKINYRRINATEPMMFITATTAAFDDFDCPMEFEYAMLYALVKSKNITEWEKRVRAIIREYAGDDFAMTVMTVGFGDFEEMKRHYEPRIKELIDEYIRPLNSARKNNSASGETALWKKYKNGYYR